MRQLYIILLCLFATTAGAQQLSHNFRNTSLSEALIWIDNAQKTYKINFIFDELEDFTVTTSLRNASVKDAVRQVVGFYPMKVSFEKNDIYVECTQKDESKVSGHVVDEKGQPLPFATVSLLAQRDSAFITGGVSTENGDFVVPCPPQRLSVKVTCIGYHTVTRNAPVGNLGTISMKPETYMVKGVTVKGEIPQYKMTTGGMTVDVQHSILHDVGTADDLLSMMPMVQVRDGKYNVMAKGEPEIYINNKKVTNASELKQLKSVDVKSVDIITAPGAQYNAEVNAVIRIKTLKTQGDGFSLMATSQTWRNNKWNSYDDLTLKYRTGGLEAFGNVALDYGHYSNDQDIEQGLKIKKDMFFAFADLPVRSNWTRLLYQTGLSYDFNADHSVGLSFSSERLLHGKFKSDMKQKYQKNGAFFADVFLKTDVEEVNKPVWELNTYYVGKAGKLGIDLNATVLRRESENHLNQREWSKELGDRTITTLNHEERRMVAGKLVLTYPIWKGMLSGGSEAYSTQSQGKTVNQEGIIPETD
ncbi:MAG: carboxypeptidase regulatory-like domain-containing protein, partial [Prevotella sp.]|nr:carboxypeptidase regulatory-like domain-containing protein [Prevotella sp.]